MRVSAFLLSTCVYALLDIPISIYVCVLIERQVKFAWTSLPTESRTSCRFPGGSGVLMGCYVQMYVTGS